MVFFSWIELLGHWSVGGHSICGPYRHAEPHWWHNVDGKGALASYSLKQKLNTRSSTEAEVVGVDDMASYVLWTCQFIEHQHFKVNETVATISNFGPASGTVLESKIDKGKGPVSTILISSGLLKRGDHFVCGNTWGKIRAIINHEGKNIDEASPSMPVEILGMNDSVFAGAEFLVTDEEKAEEIAEFNKKIVLV